MPGAVAGFVDDAALTLHLRALLKLNASEATPEWWGPLVSRANRDAWAVLVSTLANRGYDLFQIGSWAQGHEYQIALATHRLLVDGTVLEDYPNAPPKEDLLLDRREELKTVCLFDFAGARIDPDCIGHGAIERGESDVFLEQDGTFKKW